MGTYDEMDASEIEASEPVETCSLSVGKGACFEGISGTSLAALTYYAALAAADTCQEVA